MFFLLCLNICRCLGLESVDVKWRRDRSATRRHASRESLFLLEAWFCCNDSEPYGIDGDVCLEKLSQKRGALCN